MSPPFSLSPPVSESSEIVFQKLKVRLFPGAISIDSPDPSLKTPPSFFLRVGTSVRWVEVALSPFSQNDLSRYLVKARKIEKAFPQGIQGILAAPEFEASIREALELIRFPIQLFRYRERSLEELTPSLPSYEIPIESSSPSPRSSWLRLSRPELREFIQLELDAASFSKKD